MSEMTIIDWDDAYSNAAYIPGADDFIVRWAQEAEPSGKAGSKRIWMSFTAKEIVSGSMCFGHRGSPRGSSCSCTGATG